MVPTIMAWRFSTARKLTACILRTRNATANHTTKRSNAVSPNRRNLLNDIETTSAFLSEHSGWKKSLPFVPTTVHPSMASTTVISFYIVPFLVVISFFVFEFVGKLKWILFSSGKNSILRSFFLFLTEKKSHIFKTPCDFLYRLISPSLSLSLSLHVYWLFSQAAVYKREMTSSIH